MMKKSLLYISLHLCLLTASAHNDAIPDSLPDKMYELEEFVVTGTRTPKTLKDVPVLTKVISHLDIQKTDATNIQDLLQTEMPGVEFSYAMNQQVNMNLSGFAGQSVLILVDGERLAGETMDNVDFSRLSMADVERIEIVRGTASALYGSSAAGGVINIITRKEKKAWSLHADGRWGHHGEQRYNASVGVSKGWFSNNFSFSRTASDNYKVENSGTEPETSTFKEVFGEKTLNFSDRMRFDITKDLHVTGRLGFYRKTMDREEDSQERYRDYQAGVRAEWDITDKDHVEVSYSFDQYDKSDYLRTRELDVRKYSNVQNSFRMLYNRTLREADILTVGADYLYDYLLNTNLDGDSKRQQSFDVFAQYDWRITKKWELLSAVRYDYFSTDNLSRVTPKLSARWSPTKRLTVRASYGMGFRAPTLKERYYNFDMASIWIVEGTPDLKPELSHNVTIGGEYNYKGYSFTLSGNYNRINNRITTGLPYNKAGDSRQWYLAYINLSEMNVYTVEASANARWKHGFSAKASYMFTHEDLTGQTATQYMPARKHSLTVRAEWDKQFNKSLGLNLALSGRVLSGVTNYEYNDLYTHDHDTHEINYPAYSIWKFQAALRICKWAQTTFTIDNLFNYRPEYYYYNAPLTEGINFMGGVSIDIDKIF